MNELIFKTVMSNSFIQKLKVDSKYNNFLAQAWLQK